jgi:peptide subunit release factor 1 (eRF1)
MKQSEVENFISIQQKQQCDQCKLVKWEVKKTDLILDLGELAEKSNTRVEIISNQTEEGRQIQSFGGICAILRYAMTS